jgi:hypothetical protein
MNVNDKSIHVPGGLQRIQTLDGYTIPFSLKTVLHISPSNLILIMNGITYPMLSSLLSLNGIPLSLIKPLRKMSNGEMSLSLTPLWFEMGDYKHCVIVQCLSYFQRQGGDHLEDIIDQCVFGSQTSTIVTETEFYYAHQTKQDFQPTPAVPKDQPAYIPKVTLNHDPDHKQLRPFIGWLDPDIIKKTFEHTTQYARLPAGTTLKKASKSPNPALNVHCCNEAIACDIVYSDVPAIYGGATAAFIFVGVNTQITDVYGIKRIPSL